MNQAEVCRYLDEHGISYEKMEHRAVYNMEEAEALRLPHPEWDAKNLFVRDDKKQFYALITVKGDKRVDLKAFRKAQGLRNLSLASEEELMGYMRLSPGTVSPLGLLNDPAHRVHFYIDAELAEGGIAVHPNENTATLWLRTADYPEKPGGARFHRVISKSETTKRTSEVSGVFSFRCFL